MGVWVNRILYWCTPIITRVNIKWIGSSEIGPGDGLGLSTFPGGPIWLTRVRTLGECANEGSIWQPDVIVSLQTRRSGLVRTSLREWAKGALVVLAIVSSLQQG